ncbi:MAG: 50S ribosomal protein L24e [Candidatus Heimdallarchaeota archaeon]
MVRTFECNFCGHEIPPGTGIIFVRNDGSILRFCSSKCRKYMLKLRKDPRKLRWTKKYESRA